MHYFYILQSIKDNKLYYGSTSNLARRKAEHDSGKVTSTKDRRPLELIYYEAYQTTDLARNREKLVKRSISARRALKVRLGL